MAHHDHHHQTHGHAHEVGSGHRAFAIGVTLNAGFVAAEVVFGLLANSMALLADAAHNAGDVLSLLLGWGAALLVRLPPTRRRTYGWGRSSVLASLLNATILLISVGAIGLEAVRRLLAPQPVTEVVVILVAAAGILVNGVTALMFAGGRAGDLNLRTQFAHMAADAAVSAGIVLAGVLILLTGWRWLDPLASLAVAAVVLFGTWGLLRESIDLAMDAVPASVAHEDVRDYLESIPGVMEVHDLHIWGLSTTDTALTAHLVCSDAASDRRLHHLSAELRDRFGIGHSTLQIENDADAELCRLRPHDVV